MIAQVLPSGPVETSQAVGIDFGTLIIGGVIIAVVVAVVVLLILNFWPQALAVDLRTQAIRQQQLQAEITKLTGAQDVLLKMVTLADEKREEEAKARQEEAAKRIEAERKIAALQDEVRNLRQQLEDKKLIEPQRNQELSVLGIWPDTPGQPQLDQQAEADAMYNALFEYVPLRGPRANRAGVILEVDRVRPSVIQVGSHGDKTGILLSDGVAEPGWWGRVLAGKNVRLMVLLSCSSSQQDEQNLSDALLSAGVKAVVSCDSEISDKDAVGFVKILYAKLAEKTPLRTAVERAKLAVSRKGADMIRLREAG